MDFTDREEQIINAAVERALLMMPEAVQNMIMQKTVTKELTKKFLDENKEFSAHIDLIQKSIEQTELDNPGVTFGKILELATPDIKKKLITLTKLDFQPLVSKPNPILEGELVREGDHGEL